MTKRKNRNRNNKPQSAGSKKPRSQQPQVSNIEGEPLPLNPQLKSKLSAFGQSIKSVSIKAWGWIFGIATVFISVFGGNIKDVVIPHIELSTTNSLNSTEPYQAIFELQNKSPFSIKDVRIGTVIDKMVTKSGIKGSKIDISPDNLIIPYVKTDKPVSFVYDISRFMYFQYDTLYNARIAFVVHYKYLTFECQDIFVYQCVLGGSGQYVWVKYQDIG